MTIISEVITLLRKEVLIEWRQKYAIGGILLYVLSTVFIVYFSFSNMDAKSWNTLFWIVLLFASVNAVTKSFVQENSQRELYYYSLSNPVSILLSKIIYNTLLLLLISGLSYLSFSILVTNPVKNSGQFFLALFLGSLGFSIAFTFISAIAGKAANSSTLMAVLSFPTIIPILMTLLKISANALGLMTDTGIWRDIGNLLAIDLIMLTLTFILFPYLWRD